MNPDRYKITKEQYEAFQKHYMFEFIRNSDYRLGQAFLNYFPEISKLMREDGDLGTMDEFKLYNETNPKCAQEQINGWILSD